MAIELPILWNNGSSSGGSGDGSSNGNGGNGSSSGSPAGEGSGDVPNNGELSIPGEGGGLPPVPDSETGGLPNTESNLPNSGDNTTPPGATNQSGSVGGNGYGNGETTGYGKSIEISNQKMYQLGDHFNKHGREMGYTSKKDFELAARDFFDANKESCEIYEGIFNSAHGNQNTQAQYIFRCNGKQLIINK